ncbi:IspD/TarI family cytidylyltransferase [Sphingobacterium yanglingense]|uniref:2-C-methyl-D-erythritol 4-phosphate cytidylyltransferase n=1 Tax=Sphingobacterium yanglingense TaxID=1437280 RepID=A0A4R6WF16_9SPHI|nr:2-C-methyl-D-erythritol 4-phosphate cytidylyltransferase [Sphingobacterium yanglingense]TDQ73860.1 2-C-methyl-D-erythritol 4-phosphate cytidylyltransferase [Sphingobacterium yanglingense]
MPNKIAIIAAGGSGTRLQSNLPKQYLLLQDKPVLMHTILAFSGIADRIIIVLNEEMIETWRSLCQDYQFDIPHELVSGGNSRFQSVKNALCYIATNTSLFDYPTAIAVHDAARPLVDRSLIVKSFELALQGQSNVLATPSINSIRIGDKSASKAIDRNNVWQIQTPQSFPASLLIEAFEQDETPMFTDDASVVEQKGHSIQLIESTERNLKLTFAADFKIAELYLKGEL